MEFIYIAIALILVFSGYKFIIYPSIITKNINQLLEKYKDKYNIEKGIKKSYDYILEDDKKIIPLKFISVPRNSQITINNISTWKLQWGGDGAKPGRSYPNERYLHEVIPFIKQNHQSEKKIVKIIILYPRTEKILRYLNESELDIITPEKTPYGYKVTTYTNFDEDFDTLININ